MLMFLDVVAVVVVVVVAVVVVVGAGGILATGNTLGCFAGILVRMSVELLAVVAPGILQTGALAPDVDAPLRTCCFCGGG